MNRSQHQHRWVRRPCGSGSRRTSRRRRKARPSKPLLSSGVIPKPIPMRDRLYGDLLIRKFVTATVALGGVGKSSLVTTETAAQATGKALLGVAPSKPLGVWL